ncbi:MAG: FecR family protein [Polyangiaceae bacterium]|jgi:hypothetical protein|nr:FecR family protein [Polyangiaceae bacterium]
MNEPPATERLNEALLDTVRRAGDGTLPPARERIARERLALALTRPAAPTPFRLALVAFAALALLVPLLRSRQLTYEIRDASVAPEKGYVRPASSAPATIDFSDGTSVRVLADSTVRIAQADLFGAALVQEGGSALYSVRRRAASSWRVAAGPYVIKVTGTRFLVRWTPASREFSTDLLEGTVVIEGPGAPGGVQLFAGQRLRANPSGQITIEPLSTPPDTRPPLASAAPSLSVAPSIPAEPAASSPQAPAPPPAHSGTPRAASPEPRPVGRAPGQELGALLDGIELEGAEAFAARSSAAVVMEAADAARLGRRAALARSLFAALRSRHPGSREAAVAAFLLGRELDERSPGQAIALYRAYLAETGGGPFAQEARGRLLAAVARASGPEAARPLAEEYLARHPSGAHAPLARALLGAHGE